jgi:hypothetical protein
MLLWHFAVSVKKERYFQDTDSERETVSPQEKYHFVMFCSKEF